MEKIAYIFDNNHYLTGSEFVQESPREKGVYLLPANATLTPPPEPRDGYLIQYNVQTNVWNYVKDERHYLRMCNSERQWRNEELLFTDKFLLPDYPISFFKKLKVKKYRKALRDWPSNPSFPDSKYRPKAPL